MKTPPDDDTHWPTEAGVQIATTRIQRRWTDHNGHMNNASYLVLFDRSFARFCNTIGIGPKQLGQTGLTIFIAETHLVYRQELSLDDQVGVGLRVLSLGQRKMHSYLSMVRLSDKKIVCINEKMDICVDLASRKVRAFPDAVAARLQALHARESILPTPAWASRRVTMSPAQPAL